MQRRLALLLATAVATPLALSARSHASPAPAPTQPEAAPTRLPAAPTQAPTVQLATSPAGMDDFPAKGNVMPLPGPWPRADHPSRVDRLLSPPRLQSARDWCPVFVAESIYRLAGRLSPVADLDDPVDVIEAIDASYASSRADGTGVQPGGS